MTTARRLATDHRPAGALLPFRTPVRGHAFAARPPDAPPLRPGAAVVLRREPDNPADPLAVAVWAQGPGGPWRIGYLDRAVAARVAPRLDRGAAAVAELSGWWPEPEGRWQRPVVVLRVAATPMPARPSPAPSAWGRPPTAVVRPVAQRKTA